MQRDPAREALDGRADAHGHHSVSVPLDSTATLPVVPAQDAGGPRPTATIEVSLPIGVAMLIVEHGPNAGARFLLDRDVTVAGRHPDSDIFLDDITVSRQHAQFERVPSGYTIVDAGSLNGVYVNRQRVHTHALRDGDEVQIGKFRMAFHTN